MIILNSNPLLGTYNTIGGGEESQAIVGDFVAFCGSPPRGDFATFGDFPARLGTFLAHFRAVCHGRLTDPRGPGQGNPAADGTTAGPPPAPRWRILWGKGGVGDHHDFVIFQEMPQDPVKKNPAQIDIKTQLFSRFLLPFLSAGK